MEKKDISITCKDCGENFDFTVSEQEFYEEKGFENQPVRCKVCRDKKKAERRVQRESYNQDRKAA